MKKAGAEGGHVQPLLVHFKWVNKMSTWCEKARAAACRGRKQRKGLPGRSAVLIAVTTWMLGSNRRLEDCLHVMARYN